MANAFLSPKVYANAGLALLKNNLVLAKKVTTEFKDEFKKVGNTVYVKRPPEFTVRDGRVANVQDVVEGEIGVTIDKQKGVDVQFTSVEETLTVDSLMKSKTLKSAMAQLAQQVDSDLAALTKKFYHWVGTPGQTVNSYADITKAPQRLDEYAVPMDGRVGIMPPADAWAMLGNLSGLYAQEKEAKDALTKAKLPVLGNIDWYVSQTPMQVTTGTRSGNATVNGADQDVAYSEVKDGNWVQDLILASVGNDTTIKAGEVFTIADVYGVNPRTKEALPYLQQFTVIDDETASGAGAATVTISPPIIVSGAFQNCNAAPANGAAITWMGSATEGDTDATTYSYCSVFRPDALALVSAKLVMPNSGEADYATDPDTGLTVRYWRSSDWTNDTHGHRWDILYGVKAVDPRQGVRLCGTA